MTFNAAYDLNSCFLEGFLEEYHAHMGMHSCVICIDIRQKWDELSRNQFMLPRWLYPSTSLKLVRKFPLTCSEQSIPERKTPFVKKLAFNSSQNWLLCDFQTCSLYRSKLKRTVSFYACWARHNLKRLCQLPQGET